MPIFHPPAFIEFEFLRYPNIAIAQTFSNNEIYPTYTLDSYEMLKELVANDEYFLVAINGLYNFSSEKDSGAKANTVIFVERLYANSFSNCGELERCIELLNILKSKIEALPDSISKYCAHRMFTLFLLDYRARLKMRNKQFIEAARDLLELGYYAKDFVPYYEHRKDGWTEHYYYACYILYLKSSGVSDSDLIENPYYKYIDYSIKGYLSLHYPEFKELYDLEKSQKSQVRPRESEESEGSRDAKHRRVENAAEKS